MIFIFSQNKQRQNIQNKKNNRNIETTTPPFGGSIVLQNNNLFNNQPRTFLNYQMSEIMVHNKANCASCGK